MIKKILLIVILVGAVAVGVIFVFSKGEEVAIERMIHEAIDAVRKGDAPKCISFIAPDYSHNRQSYKEICSLIQMYVKPGNCQQLEIRHKSISVIGNEATCKLTVFVRLATLATEIPYPMLLRFAIKMKKIDKNWFVCAIDVASERD